MFSVVCVVDVRCGTMSLGPGHALSLSRSCSAVKAPVSVLLAGMSASEDEDDEHCF